MLKRVERRTVSIKAQNAAKNMRAPDTGAPHMNMNVIRERESWLTSKPASVAANHSVSTIAIA